MTQFLIFYSCHISWNKINKKNICIHEPISAYRSKHRFPTTLKSPFLPPPSLRKPNHRCPVTLHRPPQFFTTLSPPPDNKRYHHPSFTFFFFSLSFNLLHPCLDTFARSPRGLHNGRLILDVPSNSSARLRLPPPSLSPSLPSFLSLVGLVQSRVAALKSDTQRFFGSESIEESFISESRPVIWLYGTRGGRLWVMDE